MSKILIVGAFLITLIAIAAFLFRNRLTLRSKIVALCLLIGLGSVVSVGLIATSKSSKALHDYEMISIAALRDARKSQIEDYFIGIHEQMYNFAQNQMVIEATKNFSDAFNYLPYEITESTDPGSPIYESINGYYTDEFKPRLSDAGQPVKDSRSYIPGSVSGRVLQHWYISGNDHPVGSKLDLERAEPMTQYNVWHQKYHPQIRRFLQSFGYYDIFLFDKQGNLVYSVFKETDYATNFITGPYRDTNFGDVVRKALDADKPGQVYIEDFKPYEPSYGAPASFIASPVFFQEHLIGCAVFQMPVDNINGIMQESAGLGETGEAFLVAEDKLMRSNSRFAPEGTTTIFNQLVDTEAVTAAFSGQVGVIDATDYQGEKAMSAYTPLDFMDGEGNPVPALADGLKWAVIAEENLSELNEPATSLAKNIALAGGLVAVIVVTVSLLFAVALIKPVRGLIDRLRDMAEGEGDLTKRMDADRKDEMGEVGRWFNQFVQNVETVIIDMAGVADNVAAAATQIAASSEQMAKGMDSQTTQINAISRSIDEMSSSVVEVARKSADASSAAEEAGRVADEGGQVVRDTIEGMHSIDRAVTQSSESVQQLGQLGERIGEVISVINDIADQTNLLALNAAIEAARAGEHGRGFSVVADEVRKLADRTTKATEEVGGSILAIQSGTVDAVDAMQGGTEQVKAGVERATVAGDNLERIVASAREVSMMVQSIAAAAEQQSASSEQVSRSAEQIAAVARQSGEGASQASMAANDLSQKAEQMRSMVGRFKVSH